jgi:hypothetical protein
MIPRASHTLQRTSTARRMIERAGRTRGSVRALP